MLITRNILLFEVQTLSTFVADQHSLQTSTPHSVTNIFVVTRAPIFQNVRSFTQSITEAHESPYKAELSKHRNFSRLEFLTNLTYRVIKVFNSGHILFVRLKHKIFSKLIHSWAIPFRPTDPNFCHFPKKKQ